MSEQEATCRGCYLLGTACRKCSKCKESWNDLSDSQKKQANPAKPVKLETIARVVNALNIAKESNDYAIARCKYEINGDFAEIGYKHRNIEIDALIKELS